MPPRIAWKNFTGGEISPTLTGRYDLQRYSASARCLENMLPGLHGDAARRSGTRFVADLGQYSLLLPFSFNVEAGQNFALILSHKLLRVSDGSGLASVALAAPWATEHLPALSFAQVGDVVYVAHAAYPLHKIVRAGSPGAYVWSVRKVALNESLQAPAAPSVSFAGSGTFALRYKVVAVDKDGRESLPSPAGQTTAGKHPSDWIRGEYASVWWPAVPDAVEYNIYREEAGYFGFVGVSQSCAFLDNNYEAKTDDTPKEDWNPFADGNHPACVAFHQQRMVLGGGAKSPQSFYCSRTGDFENFRKSRPLQDDDPVEYMIASGSINAIVWAASFGDLLLGTSGAEYKATGENGVITPKHATVTAQSYWGSSGGLAPLIIGNSVMHAQRHGGRVRDLFYSLEKDGYAGNDLSIMAPHLFEGRRLTQWAYQQTPGSRIWCVRDDGLLLALTYMKEHEIFGWSRHPTQGKVRSVAVLPGTLADRVFLVVERLVNGQARFFLEVMAGDFAPDTPVEEAFFVDCGISARTAAGMQTVTGLAHLEGRPLAVLADGSPVEGCVVRNGSISLPWPARVVQAGLAYTSALSPLPVEADMQTGSTLGKRRGYGRCAVRLFRSVGGKYGADRSSLNDFPFVPERYGQPCQPFSGDLEFTPGGGQEAQASLWLVQDRPLPFHVVAVMGEVDFGQV